MAADTAKSSLSEFCAPSATVVLDPAAFLASLKKQIQGKHSIPPHQQRLTFACSHCALSDLNEFSWNCPSADEHLENPIARDFTKQLNSWQAILRSERNNIARLLNPKVFTESSELPSELKSIAAEELRRLGIPCSVYFLSFDKWILAVCSQEPKIVSDLSIQVDKTFHQKVFEVHLYGRLSKGSYPLHFSYCLNGSYIVAQLSMLEQTECYRQRHKMRQKLLRKSSCVDKSVDGSSICSTESSNQDRYIPGSKGQDLTAVISNDNAIRCIVLTVITLDEPWERSQLLMCPINCVLGKKTLESNSMAEINSVNKKDMKQLQHVQSKPVLKSLKKNSTSVSNATEPENRKGKSKSIKTTRDCNVDSASSLALDGSCSSLATDTSSSSCSSKQCTHSSKSDDKGRCSKRNKKKKERNKLKKQGNDSSLIALEAIDQRSVKSIVPEESASEQTYLDNSLKLTGYQDLHLSDSSQVISDGNPESTHYPGNTDESSAEATHICQNFESGDSVEEGRQIQSKEREIYSNYVDTRNDASSSVYHVNSDNFVDNTDCESVKIDNDRSSNKSMRPFEIPIHESISSNSLNDDQGSSEQHDETQILAFRHERESVNVSFCYDVNNLADTKHETVSYAKRSSVLDNDLHQNYSDDKMQDNKVYENTVGHDGSSAEKWCSINSERHSREPTRPRVKSHTPNRGKAKSNYEAGETAEGQTDSIDKNSHPKKVSGISTISRKNLNITASGTLSLQSVSPKGSNRYIWHRRLKELPDCNKNEVESLAKASQMNKHLEFPGSNSKNDFQKDRCILKHVPSVHEHVGKQYMPKHNESNDNFVREGNSFERLPNQECYMLNSGAVDQLTTHLNNKQTKVLASMARTETAVNNTSFRRHLGQNDGWMDKPESFESIAQDGKSESNLRQTSLSPKSNLGMTNVNFSNEVEGTGNTTISRMLGTDNRTDNCVKQRLSQSHVPTILQSYIDHNDHTNAKLSYDCHLSNDVQGSASVKKTNKVCPDSLECSTSNECTKHLSDSLRETSSPTLQELEFVGRDILRSICTSYQYQVASDEIAKEVGTPLAEFERVLHFVSPVLEAVPHMDYCNSHACHQITNMVCRCEIANIPLMSVWEWFDQPSNYGLEVKAKDFQQTIRFNIDGDYFRAYFSPSLSSIRLFGFSSAHQAQNECLLNTGLHKKDEHMSDSEAHRLPRYGNLHIDTSRTLLPKPLRSKDSDLPSSTSFSSSSAVSANQQCYTLSEEVDFRDMQTIFEYFEDDSPKDRPALSAKIKDLVKNASSSRYQLLGDPRILETVKLGDLHPASWFSVAWYPIYRIPEGRLHAAFLTYHSLGHFVYGNPTSSDSTRYAHCIKTPAVGLKTYRSKAEGWLKLNKEMHFLDESNHGNPSDLLTKRISSLEKVASSMSGSCSKGTVFTGREHSDYNYFLKRPWLS